MAEQKVTKGPAVGVLSSRVTGDATADVNEEYGKQDVRSAPEKALSGSALVDLKRQQAKYRP